MTLYNPFQFDAPYTISIYRDDPEDQLIVVSDEPGVPTIQQSINNAVVLNLNAQSDYVIRLPDHLDLTSLYIDGGRNVQIIGGSLRAVQSPVDANSNGLLCIHNQANNVFLEGLVIDANNYAGLDCFRFGAWQNTGKFPAYYVQNCKFINSTSQAGDTLHADGIQLNGNALALHMHGVDVRGQCQGFFLDIKQCRIGAVELECISVDYTDPANGQGYIFYIQQSPYQYPEMKYQHSSVFLKEVYVGARQGVWENTSVFPVATLPDGCMRVGDEVSWPSLPNIKGSVKLRTDETFCPASAGAGYNR